MNKEELLSKKLYFVKSNLTEAPYFVNCEFFVVFTDEKRADIFANSVSRRLKPYYSLAGAPALTCEITDNDAFFREMMTIGFSKFSFDGEGAILDLNDIYAIKNTVNQEEKELYIFYMGYVKMQKSSHIGSVKTQKIASAKQNLSSGSNQLKMQRFVESQKRLKQYYKGC